MLQFKAYISFLNAKSIVKRAYIVILSLVLFSLSSGQEPEVIKLPQNLTPATQAEEQINMPPAQKSSDFENFESRMTALWFKRKAYLQGNRLQDAEKQMELLKSFCQEEGIKAIPFIARALTYEGVSYLREGNFEKAKDSFQYAQYFDPLLPQPRFELARTYLKSGDGFIKSAQEFLKAIPVHFKNFWNNLIIARDISLLVITSFIFSFLFFSLFTALKYNKLLRHEISEHVSGFLEEKYAWIAGWVIFFAPLLTLIGALFIFLYWPIIIFRYMSKKEKTLCIFLFLILFLIVPGLKAVRSLSEIAVNEDIKIIVESLSEEYDPEKIIILREKIKNHPEDPLYHFLIGGHYKKGGYYKEAFDDYLKCIEIDPHSFKALNNIGNIFFKFEQYSQAVVYYKKAIDVKEDFALAYYNMSIAQSDNFHFKDSEVTLTKALSLDSSEIEKLITKTKAKRRADVVDAVIESSEIWGKTFMGKSSILAGINADSDHNRTALSLFLNPLSIVSLISMLFMTLISFLHEPSVTACVRCGKAFCRRCGIYDDSSSHCTHCVHLFIKKDGLEPDAKTKKMIAIARFENRKRKVRIFSSCFFPGSVQNLDEKIFTSAFITFLWMTGISWILLRNCFLGSVESGENPLSYFIYAFIIPVMIMSWLAGNREIILRKR